MKQMGTQTISNGKELLGSDAQHRQRRGLPNEGFGLASRGVWQGNKPGKPISDTGDWVLPVPGARLWSLLQQGDVCRPCANSAVSLRVPVFLEIVGGDA